MILPRLSVVVVSWGRPRHLARCLTALSQLRSVRVEVIVVADPEGLDVARSLPFAARLVLRDQDSENIAKARNTGIAAAAGEIVGFVDDDAVPEPDWAETILGAFAAGDVAAATGPVIGRNGMSLQWGHMAVDRTGRDRWLARSGDLAPDESLKLHGTNMAIRREALARTGGFDTGFRFYLDETDLAFRLAASGARMVYLPGARVHHGFAASTRRRADRVPTDLFDIGASSALFLRKHAPDAVDAGLDALVAEQRSRLFRLGRKRRLGATEMRRLMESLAAGIRDGRDRQSRLADIGPDPGRPFLPFRDTVPPAVTIRDGWTWRSGSLRAEAAADAAEDRPAALILIEPSPRKHHLIFTEGGWWEQRGGLFGPSDRSGPRLQLWRYAARVAAESDRLFRA